MCTAATAANAAELTGSVKSTDGKAVAGAMVTLTRADGLFVETVYAGKDGRYRLRTQQQGTASLRARYPNYADATTGVDLAKDSSQSLTLLPLSDVRAISDQMSASAHFARLPFDSATDR